MPRKDSSKPAKTAQSWSGDPCGPSYGDLLKKYVNRSPPPRTPPTRPVTGEAEHEPAAAGSDDILKGGDQLAAQLAQIKKKPSFSPWRPPSDVYSAAAPVASWLASAFGALAGIFRRSAVSPDVLRVSEEPDSPREEQGPKVYKYMNGPLAARETKSFRHAAGVRRFGGADVDSGGSAKNAKWMSCGGSEGRREGEKGGDVSEDPMNEFKVSARSNPRLLPYDLTDDERERRRRGLAAALRQYKGGRKSQSKLIKAYSYGSGARHEA